MTRAKNEGERRCVKGWTSTTSGGQMWVKPLSHPETQRWTRKENLRWLGWAATTPERWAWRAGVGSALARRRSEVDGSRLFGAMTAGQARSAAVNR